MNENKTYRLTILLLFVIPIVIMGYKLFNTHFDWSDIVPLEEYKVTYEITYEGNNKPLSISSYIPESNEHQTISPAQNFTNFIGFSSRLYKSGRKAVWSAKKTKSQGLIRYSFNYRGTKMNYIIPDTLSLPSQYPAWMDSYLKATPDIQKDSSDITELADRLATDDFTVKEKITAFFNHVHQMPEQPFNGVTDAVTALRLNEASCNGKSRLLVALCRNQNIPARLAGGIILKRGRKKTSHQWVEIHLSGKWVPFDPLNGNFASLPANYLELYKGDKFLFSHSPNINFQYIFDIQKEKVHNPKMEESLQNGTWNAYSLWNILQKNGLPFNALRGILLLPLAALIITIFRNVIGIKTFGVFLPALIALSIQASGFWFGMASIILVSCLVALLNFPLERWGLLYFPKLSILLVGVVLCYLGISIFGSRLGLTGFESIALFPVVIMVITSERFSRAIVEDGYLEGFKALGQTLLITAVSYIIMSSTALQGIFLFFPETYLIIIACLLITGKWIGLRFTEYVRFHPLLIEKQQS